MRRIGFALRWLIREGFMAACLLIVCLALGWVALGLYPHALPMVHGEFGTYGQLELPAIIGPHTEILEFSAIRIPSRIAWRVVPMPDTIEILVQYRNPDRIVRTWERAFLAACDSEGTCVSVISLRGILMYGKNIRGDLVPCGWIALVPVNPPMILRRNLEKPPFPKDLQMVSAPRLFIRAGRFFFDAW